MPETARRDEYLDWMAEKLDDPDDYVRYLADKLAREELEREEPVPADEPRRPPRS